MDTVNEVIIETSNLTKRFRATVAVEGLNLAVKRGEIFGLVGPDGAGKTTTIRLLASIMVPTEGTAIVAGYDTVKQAEDIKKHIGYMAQGFNLYGDLSVVENLRFFADVFQVGRREREERLAQLLDFARLAEFRSRRAMHLSGGMQKKLALACTLIHRPEILFLDEPTTGIDPVSRREFWDILLDLHLQGITIFVSTPYMDEAERCSRVGLMYQGHLIVCEEPERIKEMVSGDLIEIRPSHLRQASEALASLEGVLEIQTYGDLLHVFVDSAPRRIAELAAYLSACGVGVQSIRQIRPRMEEAFISLIRKQLGER